DEGASRPWSAHPGPAGIPVCQRVRRQHVRSLKVMWRVGLGTLVAVSVAFVAPATAQAATWYKTAGTTQNGYSWNSYKAHVYTSAYPTAPSGYKAYSKKVTVKTTSGTTLATKVSSSLRGPGTYKAYTYFT